jgi:di/tripeptidase
VNRAVGSSRYEVEIATDGGHSFGAFGNTNAIAVMSDIITKIYDINVPEIEGTRTTYNVGTVSGGTSVNTIAQNAKMLCEYRSDSAECLEIMKNKFLDIFKSGYDAKIAVRIVGERPCGANVDENEQRLLEDICERAMRKISGCIPDRKSGSTDCNIPLSLGVPSVCIGVAKGGGTHTREEWLEKASLVSGFELSLEIATSL